jgi:hypothetical protein
MTSICCFFMLSVFYTSRVLKRVQVARGTCQASRKGSHELRLHCIFCPTDTPAANNQRRLDLSLTRRNKGNTTPRLVPYNRPVRLRQPHLHLIPPTTSRLKLPHDSLPSSLVPLYRYNPHNHPTTLTNHFHHGRSCISTARQPAGSAGHNPHLAY